MATALSAALKSSLFAAPSVSAARTQQHRRQTVRYANIRAGEEPVDAQPSAKPAEKAAPKPQIGPKRGSMVRIKRPESFWYLNEGKVVSVDQSESKILYPVVVRFESPSYSGVTTSNYALDEVEEV
eukprot:TRINITY_DN2679_c0_g1_i1.p1 TRINITY_DN2679_c0_g1~~TRINITY_DN2679_c0_g1_i1.p1  ORF type:complete len:126 (-),score=12.91 TRINITY_DN2679_c0_g1_i1:359-736(-)